MLMSLRVGTNDIAKARAFYNATFGALGAGSSIVPEASPIAMYKLPDGPMFLVGPAANGEPATHANGGTLLFIAANEGEVDAWYKGGMAHGGICEGAPGPRAQINNKYGAYMRDPDGNKLGCYVGNLFAQMSG